MQKSETGNNHPNRAVGCRIFIIFFGFSSFFAIHISELKRQKAAIRLTEKSLQKKRNKKQTETHANWLRLTINDHSEANKSK